MARHQLSGLDLAFLCLDRALTPLHFGAMLVFGASEPSVGTSAVVKLLRERCARLPELRQRAEPSWWPPGGAAWVEDPHFRAADHIRSRRLRTPGDQQELLAAMTELMTRPLAPDRPLWKIQVIGGLGGGRFAVLAAMHHAMCDGAAAIELGLGLFDEFAAPAGVEHARSGSLSPHTPAGNRVSSPLSGITGAAGRLADCVGKIRESVGIGRAVVNGLRLPDPASPLRAAQGQHRRIDLVEFDLADLRRIAARHATTINDVVLAMVAGALRHCLGPNPPRVRALVPVDLRPTTPAESTRNHISAYLCGLPLAEPDPLRRLLAISTRMTREKSAGPRHGPGAFPVLADRIPGGVHRLVTPALTGAGPWLFDLVVTNVALPDVGLSMGGAPLATVFPIIPLAEGHGVSIAVCGYRGRACVGIQSRPQAHLKHLASALPTALDELHGR